MIETDVSILEDRLARWKTLDEIRGKLKNAIALFSSAEFAKSEDRNILRYEMDLGGRLRSKECDFKCKSPGVVINPHGLNACEFSNAMLMALTAKLQIIEKDMKDL